MKTITAKEFQLRHAAVVKEVAGGREYEVTFHRSPRIKLVPINKTTKRLKPGTRDAFLRSLQNTVRSTGDVHDLAYKELRNRMLSKKYGK